MEPTRYQSSRKPESILQDKIIKTLRYYEWVVIPTHGSKYQAGVPDLVCMHMRYQWKFVEVKIENKFSFTAAQEHWFPSLKKIWIMTGDDQHARLMKPPNWTHYLARVMGHKSKPFTPPPTTPSKDRGALDIMLHLQGQGYKVMHTHGNVYQRGLPDLLAVHPTKGIKWVEVKEEKVRFTGAQLKYLRQMLICNFPVWIIQSPTELWKLDGLPNIKDYLYV